MSVRLINAVMAVKFRSFLEENDSYVTRDLPLLRAALE
jgi:hypothetical protein